MECVRTLDAFPDYAERARLVLDALKRHRDLTDEEVGSRSGLSRIEVIKRRRGDTAIKVDDAARLAVALGVHPVVFFMEPAEAIRWALDHDSNVRPIRPSARRDKDLSSTIWSGAWAA